MIYPRWSTDSYGPADTAWNASLPVIRQQTNAHFLEIPLLFSQASDSATVVSATSAPTIASVAAGIQQAEFAGYQVFLVPLLTVRSTHPWAGAISFVGAAATAAESAWFDSYWQAYQPYVALAAREHVFQLALGTELDWLQRHAPASLWQRLIDRIASIYAGKITYDLNWDTVQDPPDTWELDPHLSALGVSAYFPLEPSPLQVAEDVLLARWKMLVLPLLDHLAVQSQKPVLISEIGYRAYTDTAYQPWSQETPTRAAPSPQAQADAIQAALASVLGDSHIEGIYLWGWNGVSGMQLEGSQAISVIAQAYVIGKAGE